MRYEIYEETGNIRRKPIIKDDTLIIPKGAHTIGRLSFLNSLEFKDVKIDEDKSLLIRYGAFDGSNLTNIYFPKELKHISIDERAFRYCVNLKEINLPDNLKYLPYNVFEGCKNLKTVAFPENLTEIGTEAFLACDSLENVYLPEKTTVIWDYAFRYCKSLKTIELSDNTEYIGEGAFLGCDSLESIFYRNCNIIDFMDSYGTIEEDMEDINDFINEYNNTR